MYNVTGVYIVGAVALLIFCIGGLFKIHNILDVPIKKTNAEIRSLIETLNPDSQNASEKIDKICKLQRRKSHLHGDIQNSFSMWMVAAILLIMISLESLLGINNPLLSITVKSLVVVVGILIFFGFCYILRFSIEIKKINRADNLNV